MTCLKKNTEKKKLKKRTTYRQLASKITERSPEFKVKVELLVISAFGGGIKEILKLEKIFEKDDLCEKILAEMQKTILIDSKTINQKVNLSIFN